MTREEAIAIIRKEYLCVDRDCDIERSCGKCDLMMPSKEPILEAYKVAIKALEHPEQNVIAVVPCGDAISRQAAIDAFYKYPNIDWTTLDVLAKIKELPSVNPAERATYRKKAKRWKKKYFALKTDIEKAKTEIYEKAKEREFYLDSGHPYNGLYEALKIIDKHLKAERSEE